LCLAVGAGAASYHVSSRGSDGRTAAEAGSPETPWASFANLLSAPLQPGDSILILRGDTLRGTLKFSRSGTSSNPIVVAPYGPGSEPPTLLGTLPVTGWTANPSGGWKAKIPSGHPVTRVFLGGQPMRNARLPDTGWFRTAGHVGNTVVIAPEAAGGDWVGASLYLWNLNWDMEGHRVRNQAGDHLELERRNGIDLADTALYALTNHPLALRVPGTWVYTASDSALLVLGDKPADSALEASVRSAGVDLRGANWVRVSGLRVVGSADTGITSNGQGIVVERCEVRFADHVGIHLYGPDAVVRDCRVSGSSSAGISVRGKRGLAQGNTVSRVMVAPWLGPNGMGASCCTGNGLNVWGDTSLALGNRVDSVGFNGIGFGGVGARVTENHVSNACMLANDCAGIYTGPQLPPQSGSEGSRVWHNVVHDSRKSAWPWPWPASNGIYLDAYAHDIVVDSNVVWNVDKGFHGNNGRGIVYRDNLLFGFRYAPGDFANNDSARLGTAIGATLRGNRIVVPPGVRTEFARYIPQAWQSQARLEAVDNLVCEDRTTRILCRRDSLRIWSAPTVDPDAPFFGTQVVPNGSFDSAVAGWRRWPSQLTLSVDSGGRCVSGRCLRVDWVGDTVAGSPYLGTAPVIRTDSAQGWWLQFRARSRRPGAKLTAVFRRPVDYATIGLAAVSVLDTIWQDYSFHFKATQRYDSARLDFHCPKKDSTFWLDGIVLRKDADSAAWAALGPSSVLLWNASGEASQRPVPSGNWVDEQGRVATGSVVVPPWSGLVLFRVFADPAGVEARFRSVAGWRVRRSHGGMLLEGLVDEAEVFDLHGRRIARLQPDATGRAWWAGAPVGGLLLIRSSGNARVVVSPR